MGVWLRSPSKVTFWLCRTEMIFSSAGSGVTPTGLRGASPPGFCARPGPPPGIARSPAASTAATTNRRDMGTS